MKYFLYTEAGDGINATTHDSIESMLAAVASKYGNCHEGEGQTIVNDNGEQLADWGESE